MKEFKVSIGLIALDGSFRLQTEKSSIALIVVPKLNLNLSVNGVNLDSHANFGDSLNYGLVYQNDSDLEIKNLTLTFRFEGDDIIDWDSLKIVQDPSAKIPQVKKQPSSGPSNIYLLTWTKDEIEGLALLKPQDQGKINFQLKTKSPPIASAKTNYHFSCQVKGNGELEELGGFTAESNSVITKMNTRLNLDTEARYYDEEYRPVGSGPLPPEVGRTTIYKVFWHLNNSYNDVQDVRVHTTLPPHVFWTGKFSVSTGDALKFDPETQEVSWQINKVSSLAGLTRPSPETSFEISVTPEKKDIGKLLVLTRETQLSAQDAYTGATINQTCELITSNLINDVGAHGQGIVVPSTLFNVKEN